MKEYYKRQNEIIETILKDPKTIVTIAKKLNGKLYTQYAWFSNRCTHHTSKVFSASSFKFLFEPIEDIEECTPYDLNHVVINTLERLLHSNNEALSNLELE